MGFFIFGIILIIAAYLLKGVNKATPEKFNLKPVAWVIKIVAIVFIVIGFIASTIVIIPAGNRGVLMRFQAVVGTLTEGIHIIMPYVNTVEIIEVRTQKESSEASAASKDMQIVSTSLALNYHIDPTKTGELYKSVGLDYKSRVIDPAVQESIKMVTAQYTAEELIKSRAAVKSQVEADITRRLLIYDIIVEPGGLSITNFNFSQEFNAAIERKQVAQQEAEQQKYLLQKAELERQTVIAKAKGEAESAKLRALSLQAAGGSKVLAKEWIEKWDGKLPQITSSGSNLIVDLRSLMGTTPGE